MTEAFKNSLQNPTSLKIYHQAPPRKKVIAGGGEGVDSFTDNITRGQAQSNFKTEFEVKTSWLKMRSLFTDSSEEGRKLQMLIFIQNSRCMALSCWWGDQWFDLIKKSGAKRVVVVQWNYRIRPLHKINIVNIRGHLLYSTKGPDKNETSFSVTILVTLGEGMQWGFMREGRLKVLYRRNGRE